MNRICQNKSFYKFFLMIDYIFNTFDADKK
jgi:hypothetical protein